MFIEKRREPSKSPPIDDSSFNTLQTAIRGSGKLDDDTLELFRESFNPKKNDGEQDSLT